MEEDKFWLAVKRMKKKGPYKLNSQRWKGPYDMRRRFSTTAYLIGKHEQKQIQVVNLAHLVPVIQRHPDLVVPKSTVAEMPAPAEVADHPDKRFLDEPSE